MPEEAEPSGNDEREVALSSARGTTLCSRPAREPLLALDVWCCLVVWCCAKHATREDSTTTVWFDLEEVSNQECGLSSDVATEWRHREDQMAP